MVAYLILFCLHKYWMLYKWYPLIYVFFKLFQHYLINLYFNLCCLLQKSKSGKVAFVKVHAPWSVLAKGAELMNMKMPLAVCIWYTQQILVDECLLGDAKLRNAKAFGSNNVQRDFDGVQTHAWQTINQYIVTNMRTTEPLFPLMTKYNTKIKYISNAHKYISAIRLAVLLHWMKGT